MISNGALAGRTLHEAMGLWAPGLLAGGGFPLLVKFLDARERRSVQVHPCARVCARRRCAPEDPSAGM